LHAIITHQNTVGFIPVCTMRSALLRYYTAYSGNSLPTLGTTYWLNLQGSRNPRRTSWILGPV